MCKFHKDVAADVATDENGAFDPGKYAVALVAMTHFRIEQYMPAMFNVTGFVPAEMVTDEAVQALKDSGLRTCPTAVRKYRDENIGKLRAAMDETAKVFRLTPEDLNVPSSDGEITKEGYKPTPQSTPLKDQNHPFLNTMMVYGMEGYDDEEKTYASKKLTLSAEAPAPEFEAIRMATEHFISQPEVMNILEQMFEDKIARIFKEAPANLEDGPKTAAPCAMCHTESRQPPKPGQG